MGLGQYLKDTRAELRHVAWPTQTQTIVYTILVIVLSIFVSLYLGFFDFLFTGILQRVINGASPIEITQPVSTSTAANTVPTLSTSTNFK